MRRFYTSSLREHLHNNLSLGRTDLFLESTRTRLAFLAAAQVSSSATCWWRTYACSFPSCLEICSPPDQAAETLVLGQPELSAVACCHKLSISFACSHFTGLYKTALLLASSIAKSACFLLPFYTQRTCCPSQQWHLVLLALDQCCKNLFLPRCSSLLARRRRGGLMAALPTMPMPMSKKGDRKLFQSLLNAHAYQACNYGPTFSL